MIITSLVGATALSLFVWAVENDDDDHQLDGSVLPWLIAGVLLSPVAALAGRAAGIPFSSDLAIGLWGSAMVVIPLVLVAIDLEQWLISRFYTQAAGLAIVAVGVTGSEPMRIILLGIGFGISNWILNGLVNRIHQEGFGGGDVDLSLTFGLMVGFAVSPDSAVSWISNLFGLMAVTLLLQVAFSAGLYFVRKLKPEFMEDPDPPDIDDGTLMKSSAPLAPAFYVGAWVMVLLGGHL